MKVSKTLIPVTLQGTRVLGTSEVVGYLALTPGQARILEKKGKPYIFLKKMTEPEDVPIMKNAAAVLTTEGGVTCHAAIVCTALGTPCITNINALFCSTRRSTVITVGSVALPDGAKCELLPKSKVFIKDSDVTFELEAV